MDGLNNKYEFILFDFHCQGHSATQCILSIELLRFICDNKQLMYCIHIQLYRYTNIVSMYIH